jgi:hypothetical protein
VCQAFPNIAPGRMLPQGRTAQGNTHPPRRVILPMDIGFTIAVLLIVFLMATAIGFAVTGFSRR